MKPGTQKLSEVARELVIPVGIVSTSWPQVRDTCHRLGWSFDGWQDGAGRLICSRRADGLYAAETIVLSIPRQVGKTYLVACIVFALCLIHPGITVIWTAHLKTTASETFESLAIMAAKPKVAPHIRGVKHGRGDEKILFKNGSRLLLGARESGFGRGFTNVTIIVLDEAQQLTEATMEDMAAAQNVVADPLLFMMGTPPRPKDSGEIFTMERDEALDPDNRDTNETLYIELAARPEARTDPMNPQHIAQANPSYPHRTTHRAMLRLRKRLKSLDSWFREALGLWDPVSVHKAIISDSQWADEIDVGPTDSTAPGAIGVDMSHGMEISVGAAWIEGDSAHLEEIWAGTDVDAAITWIATAAGRRIEVLIDDLSPAAQMIPALKARGVKVRRSTTRDMVKGCLIFETRGKAGTLTHADQRSVNAARTGARKRLIANSGGGWGYDRSDSTAVIHQLVSITLALLGATEKYRPATESDSNQHVGRGSVL